MSFYHSSVTNKLLDRIHVGLDKTVVSLSRRKTFLLSQKILIIMCIARQTLGLIERVYCMILFILRCMN